MLRNVCSPPRYLSIAESMEATDVLNLALNYGVVVDCGSSGSRVFVYYWPPHNGNPHTLLDIRQMRDRDHKPVVKKIKPGEGAELGPCRLVYLKKNKTKKNCSVLVIYSQSVGFFRFIIHFRGFSLFR